MIYLVTAAFIVLDIVTGVVKAAKEGGFSSSVMKKGLVSKLGSVLVIALGILIDYAQGFMDLGIKLHVASAFCVTISTMEIGSIIENACIINPDLLPKKFKSYFEKLASDDDEENTEAE